MFENSPHYISRNTGRLADIVGDHYDSFVDRFKYNSKVSYYSVIDDLDVIKLGQPIDKIVNKTSKVLEKTKNLNHPLIKATCLSVAANMAVSYIFKDNNAGYVAESFTYSLAFPCYYWLANKDSTVSNNKTRVGIDLLVLGAASFLLSIGPYRMGRNEIIDQVVQHNYLGFIHNPDSMRSVAAGVTQLALMPIFAGVLNPVKKGIDYLDKKFKFKFKLVENVDSPMVMFDKTKETFSKLRLLYNPEKVNTETKNTPHKPTKDDDLSTSTDI